MAFSGLCFTAEEAGSTVTLTKYNSPSWTGQYSLDGETWSAYTPSSTGAITLTNIGDKVYFWTQSEVLNQGEREKTRQAYMVFGDNYGQLFMDSMYHTYKHFGLSVRCLKD